MLCNASEVALFTDESGAESALSDSFVWACQLTGMKQLIMDDY